MENADNIPSGVLLASDAIPDAIDDSGISPAQSEEEEVMVAAKTQAPAAEAAPMDTAEGMVAQDLAPPPATASKKGDAGKPADPTDKGATALENPETVVASHGSEPSKHPRSRTHAEVVAQAVTEAVAAERRRVARAAGKQPEKAPAAPKQLARAQKPAPLAKKQPAKAAPLERGEGCGLSARDKLAEAEPFKIPQKNPEFEFLKDRLKLGLKQQERLRALINAAPTDELRQRYTLAQLEQAVELGDLEREAVVVSRYASLADWTSIVAAAEQSLVDSEVRLSQEDEFSPVPRKKAARPSQNLRFGPAPVGGEPVIARNEEIELGHGVVHSTPAQKHATHLARMEALSLSATIARQAQRQKVAEEREMLQAAMALAQEEREALDVQLAAYQRSMLDLTQNDDVESSSDEDMSPSAQAKRREKQDKRDEEARLRELQKRAQEPAENVWEAKAKTDAAAAEARHKAEARAKAEAALVEATKALAALTTEALATEGESGKRSRSDSPDGRALKSPKNKVSKLSVTLQAHLTEIEQLWLNPLDERPAAEYSHLVSVGHLPKYAGDYKDPYTVVEWLQEVGQLFFHVAGVPVSRAVGIVGQCFPIASPARVVYTETLKKDPKTDFAVLASIMLEKFYGQHIQEGYASQLHTLHQGTQKVVDFVSKHTRLWARVHPSATEEQQLLDLSHRLGGADAQEFRKWEVRLARKGHTRTMQDLMAHLVEKERDRQNNTRASALVIDTTPPHKQKNQKKPQKVAGADPTRKRPKPDYTLPNCQSCGQKGHHEGQTGKDGCYLMEEPGCRIECYVCQKPGHLAQSPRCSMLGQKAPRRHFGTQGKKYEKK